MVLFFTDKITRITIQSLDIKLYYIVLDPRAHGKEFDTHASTDLNIYVQFISSTSSGGRRKIFVHSEILLIALATAVLLGFSLADSSFPSERSTSGCS